MAGAGVPSVDMLFAFRRPSGRCPDEVPGGRDLNQVRPNPRSPGCTREGRNRYIQGCEGFGSVLAGSKMKHEPDAEGNRRSSRDRRSRHAHRSVWRRSPPSSGARRDTVERPASASGAASSAVPAVSSAAVSSAAGSPAVASSATTSGGGSSSAAPSTTAAPTKASTTPTPSKSASAKPTAKPAA